MIGFYISTVLEVYRLLQDIAEQSGFGNRSHLISYILAEWTSDELENLVSKAKKLRTREAKQKRRCPPIEPVFKPIHNEPYIRPDRMKFTPYRNDPNQNEGE